MMTKRKGIRPENRIKSPPRSQKSNRELCIKEINAALQKRDCHLVAIPIGAIAEGGQFEYRSSEIRIEENRPRPQVEKTADLATPAQTDPPARQADGTV
jgi:hypothetical protein